jgi:hypothetical protein
MLLAAISFHLVLEQTKLKYNVDEKYLIDCFLLFQEIRESPKKIQNPVTDLRSVGSLP